MVNLPSFNKVLEFLRKTDSEKLIFEEIPYEYYPEFKIKGLIVKSKEIQGSKNQLYFIKLDLSDRESSIIRKINNSFSKSSILSIQSFENLLKELRNSGIELELEQFGYIKSYESEVSSSGLESINSKTNLTLISAKHFLEKYKTVLRYYNPTCNFYLNLFIKDKEEKLDSSFLIQGTSNFSINPTGKEVANFETKESNGITIANFSPLSNGNFNFNREEFNLFLEKNKQILLLGEVANLEWDFLEGFIDEKYLLNNPSSF